jgi:L-aminopeptidase/D-esterase-like protein
VTAILPRGRQFDPVFAAHHILNGNGDMTGTHWVQESGFLETPILITNTGSVGVVRDAALGWMNRNKYFSPLIAHVWFAYPLVAETYDGVLNDMYGFHVKPEHVVAALDSAKTGPVAEGNVGGGTGMSCLGFKCGTGTASRRASFGPNSHMLGVLVQANFGGRNQLTIAGVPVGREITGAEMKMNFGVAGDAAGRGSIIAIAATDAPLGPHQLRRIAQRISLGIGRTGGTGGNGSGDIFLAFSTANPGAFRRGGTSTIQLLSNDDMNYLMDATVDATEEAIINAMIAARTMTGANGNTIYAIPHDQLRDILRKYNRLQEPR